MVTPPFFDAYTHIFWWFSLRLRARLRQALSERYIVHEKAGDLWEVSMGVQRRNLRGKNIMIYIYVCVCVLCNDMYNYIYIPESSLGCPRGTWNSGHLRDALE